jgi:hypothetical protein
MARVNARPKFTVKFNYDNIGVNFAIVRDIYTFAETSDCARLSSIAVGNMGRYFEEDGFSDEFTQCLHAVRERYKGERIADIKQDPLRALYSVFQHWLDSDYADRTKEDFDLSTIRRHLFLDQLSAYWEWFGRAAVVLAKITSSIEWNAKASPELCNSMYTLCNSVPRMRLKMDVVSKAFVKLLCTVRSPTNKDPSGAWRLLSENSELITPFLPQGSEYFDPPRKPFARAVDFVRKPFTAAEQRLVAHAFGTMGTGALPDPSTYNGPGVEWEALCKRIQEIALACVFTMETTLEQERVVADDQYTGDIAQLWASYLSDEKREEEEDEFAEGTLMNAVLKQRLNTFNAAEAIVDEAWKRSFQFKVVGHTAADERQFYQEHIVWYPKTTSTWSRETIGWSVMRVLRRRLLAYAEEHQAIVLAADASGKGSSEVETARGIIGDITDVLMMKNGKDDAVERRIRRIYASTVADNRAAQFLKDVYTMDRLSKNLF